MSEKEDLREFFSAFESTQQARRTPREAYAATLLPLLNPVCKSLALSLPADSRTSYSCLKRELLAQADSRSDATVQVIWEHRKPKGRTWREEAASLTKLARRCAANVTVAQEYTGVCERDAFQLGPVARLDFDILQSTPPG